MDAKSVEILHNQDLMRAVKYLYKTDRINKDKDIVDAMKPYKKNTVSGYISGKIPASERFRTKFEEVFKLDLSKFKNDLPQVDNETQHETNVSGIAIGGLGEKYLALLEKTIADKDKTLQEKEDDLNAFRQALRRFDNLETTVGVLQGKWRDYEPTILGLREFVTGELAALKKKSHEEVAAALDIKVEEQRKKVELSYTQKG